MNKNQYQKPLPKDLPTWLKIQKNLNIQIHYNQKLFRQIDHKNSDKKKDHNQVDYPLIKDNSKEHQIKAEDIQDIQNYERQSFQYADHKKKLQDMKLKLQQMKQQVLQEQQVFKVQAKQDFFLSTQMMKEMNKNINEMEEEKKKNNSEYLESMQLQNNKDFLGSANDIEFTNYDNFLVQNNNAYYDKQYHFNNTQCFGDYDSNQSSQNSQTCLQQGFNYQPQSTMYSGQQDNYQIVNIQEYVIGVLDGDSMEIDINKGIK